MMSELEEGITQEQGDDCKVLCVIDAISLQKAAIKQLHYTNVWNRR